MRIIPETVGRDIWGKRISRVWYGEGGVYIENMEDGGILCIEIGGDEGAGLSVIFLEEEGGEVWPREEERKILPVIMEFVSRRRDFATWGDWYRNELALRGEAIQERVAKGKERKAGGRVAYADKAVDGTGTLIDQEETLLS